MSVELGVLIVAGYGLTSVVTHSLIAKPVRNFLSKRSLKIYEFVKCPQCVGFWVGVLLTILVPELLDIAEFPVLNWLLAGFVVSGSSWFIHAILESLGIYVVDEEPE